MKLGRAEVLPTLGVLAVLLALALGDAQADLQYQNRGTYYEGIRSNPVSGYAIELISARVDYEEEAGDGPGDAEAGAAVERLKVRFYLDEPARVHLTVREIDPKHYYWLDRVTPPDPWRAGFDNVFEWSARTVIGRLDLPLHDLGVVARLGTAVPGSIERVAPALLFHTRVPEEVSGYLFTFRLNVDARLSATIHPLGSTAPVFSETFRRLRGGRPFTVRWHSVGSEEGLYRLVVSGFSLSDNSRIDQEVLFHHRPRIVSD